uniref:Uncharacterized protein n=1 Tax=Caenorhabditis tropicalis TaxID=1561998 RepID=A0A1I7TBU1_9PELO
MLIIIWNNALIEHLLLLPLITIFIVSSCAQRASSSRERGPRRDDSASGSQKQHSVQETEKEGKRSEYSQKSQKMDRMQDSIKIMRGRKPNRKIKDPKEMKPDRSDSQHTEIINVPLGKANESPMPSKPKEESKDVAPRKIKFAEKLIKSNKTPTKTPKVVSKRSTKGTFSRKKLRSAKRND